MIATVNKKNIRSALTSNPILRDKVSQVLMDYTSKCGKFIVLFKFDGKMNLWACFLRISGQIP